MTERQAKRFLFVILIAAMSVLVMLSVSHLLAAPITRRPPDTLPLTVEWVYSLHKQGAMFRRTMDPSDGGKPIRVEQFRLRNPWMSFASCRADCVTFTDGSDGCGWTLQELEAGAIEYTLNPPSGSVIKLGR